MLTKSEFQELKVKDIKNLLQDECPFDYVQWSLEDSRESVKQAAGVYLRKQKKVLEEQQRLEAMYAYEDSFYEEGKFLVAGVDEVGRGPIAGPVTVAAVILPPHCKLVGLNDSKKLTPEKRDTLFDQIMEVAVAVHCVSYEAEVIDTLNIYEATRQAMYEAIRNLPVQAEAVLSDAMKLPELTIPVESLIKGDSKSASIAAASIVAKVTRDRFMESMDEEYPGFGFAIHKGYYTDVHKQAIKDLGITPLHRHSFEPIKSIVAGKPVEEI